MNTFKPVRLLLSSVLILASTGLTHAQEAPDEPDMIVVTGSRLPQRDLTAAAPVTVLDRAEIDVTGATNIGELLRELPAAGASNSESAGRGNNGSATVALRGLSAVNTLVLINGRRVLSNNSGGTVDLNSIPFDAVERVEVLKDGASAIYGSDAIAGVVNIIMRRDFDGLLLRGGYGISSRGDLPNRELSLTFGQELDRGGFVFNASYRNSDGNVIADRPVSRDPDWRAQGGRNFRDPLPPRVVVQGLDPNDPDREMVLREGVAQATSIDDFRDFVFPDTDTPLTSGNDGINYWEHETSAVDIETANLWFSGNYEIDDNLSTFVDASFNNRQSFGFLAPNYFGAVFGEPVILSANNDYNPFGVDLSVARTIIEQLEEPETRSRQSDVNANTYRLVAGLEGALGEWNWEASFNHQQLHQYTYGGRNRVMEWIRQAAGDSDACRAATNGCVPINLMGEPGTITKEMRDFISADSFTDITSKLDSVVANVTGTVFELPNGDVNLAMGAEYRVVEFDQNGLSINEFIEQGTDQDAHPPSRKVSEVYFETGLPLLADLPLVRSLDLEFAVRYSHYSDFGNTTNPKVGIKWRPTEDLLLRASWGTGFRAPTFNEAYGGQSRGFRPVEDPCLGPDFADYPGCNGEQATTTSSGAFIVSGGNPELDPEEADNLTIGAVWRPEFLSGLALTLDYYQIEKSGIIGTANINFIIEQNALNGSFADRVTRDAGNAVFEVIATLDNLLTQDVRGYDLGLQYQTEPSSIGVFDARLNLTFLESFERSPAPGEPAIEHVGDYSVEFGSLADFRWNGYLNWSLGNFDVTTGVRYIGGVTNTGSLMVNGAHLEADDYVQNDLFMNYLFEDLGVTVALGIENVFDEMPPWLEGNYFNGFDEGSFHSRGRFYYTRIEKRF